MEPGQEAEVLFTRLFNRYTGERHLLDMHWDGLEFTEGGFSELQAVNDRITGRFFRPGHKEVAGTFAAMIFGKWRPGLALVACLFFGFLDTIIRRIDGVGVVSGRRPSIRLEVSVAV